MLTKEQFEELHEEFATFLAAQQIDVNEWSNIKKNKPEVAQEEMELFSDMVWDRVLDKAKYLEHFSEKTINLFRIEAEQISRVVVQVDKDVNLLEKVGYQWFMDNSNDDAIEYLKGQKPFLKEKKEEIFDLIKQGCVISEGELFESVFKIIS